MKIINNKTDLFFYNSRILYKMSISTINTDDTMDIEETVNYEYLYKLQLQLNTQLNMEIEEMKKKCEKLENDLNDAITSLLEVSEENLDTGPIETTDDA